MEPLHQILVTVGMEGPGPGVGHWMIIMENQGNGESTGSAIMDMGTTVTTA